MSSWDSLKKIGSSYVSLISILVPIFGYVVFAADLTTIGYSALLEYAESRGIQVDIDTPASFLRLKMTYVGLSIVGLTALAFKIVCPKTISVYEDAPEYAHSSISVAHEGAMESIKSELKKRPWFDDAVRNQGDSTIELKNSYEGASPTIRARIKDDARLRRTEWIEQNHDQLNKAFLTLYDRENYSLFVFRILVFLGFAVGYVITLLPGLQMLDQPLKEVFGYLLSW